HDGAADLAGADHGGVPLPVGAENRPELGDELASSIADTRMTELTEAGEILADLRIGEPQRFAELLGTDRLSPMFEPPFKLAQIQAQTPDGGARNLRAVGHQRIVLRSAMHFRDIVARDGRTISFEFFPPKTSDGWENLFASIKELEPFAPSFVSVTYGAGGST